MTLNYYQKRLIVLLRKRVVTDSISWLLLLLLTIGYIHIKIYTLYDEPTFQSIINCLSHNEQNISDFFSVPIKGIIEEAVLYVLGIMIMVYINLGIIKKNTLDKPFSRQKRYTYYLLGVLILTAGLAWLWVILDEETRIFCMRVKFSGAVIVNFTFALISTGLIYLKELQDSQAKIDELEKELEIIQENQEKEEESMPTLSQDYIKIGSKNNWRIIYLKDILYLEGDGDNGTFIYSAYQKYHSSKFLGEFENILPKSGFIRTSRSHIISKSKLVGRKRKNGVDKLILRDRKGNLYDDPKLGGSEYKTNFEQDSDLRFE